MKKAVAVLVVAALALLVWRQYAVLVRKVREGPQGEPVRAVSVFMDTTAKLSTLLWNADEREGVKKGLDEWKRASEKDDDADLPEVLKKYGMVNPTPLFADPRYGKAAMTILCFYQFDSFSVATSDVGEERAVVTVEFLPQDILGLGSLLAKRGAPAGEMKKEPVSIPFHLEKRGHRWHIVEMGGQVGKAVTAARKLRGRR